MEKSFLRTNSVKIIDTIDQETGEVIDTQELHTTYLANTKEEFYLMYSSMVLILKGSTDVRMKLFAALLERYAHGQEFSISKGFKEILAKEVGCSPRSFDSVIARLTEENVIVRISTGLYRINPRHVFQGSSKDRNGALKAIIELGCKEC